MILLDNRVVIVKESASLATSEALEAVLFDQLIRVFGVNRCDTIQVTQKVNLILKCRFLFSRKKCKVPAVSFLTHFSGFQPRLPLDQIKSTFFAPEKKLLCKMQGVMILKTIWLDCLILYSNVYLVAKTGISRRVYSVVDSHSHAITM